MCRREGWNLYPVALRSSSCIFAQKWSLVVFKGLQCWGFELGQMGFKTNCFTCCAIYVTINKSFLQNTPELDYLDLFLPLLFFFKAYEPQVHNE